MVGEGATFTIAFETIDKGTLQAFRQLERAAKKAAKGIDDDFEKADAQLSKTQRSVTAVNAALSAGGLSALRFSLDFRTALAAVGTSVVAVETALSSFGSGALRFATDFRTALAAVGAAVVVDRTVDFGFGLVEAASDAEETRSKFEAVFKEFTDDADAAVSSIAASVGRSTSELENFFSTLQDTFVPLEFTREEALQLSDTLTKLAIDLASFNNQAEPEVLAALQSGIVGNVEALRRYGIIITQTVLNQELLARGIEGGVQAANEQEKALARVAIILRSTTDAQGDAIRTADSYANRMRRLQSEIRGVREELGAELIVAINDVIDDLGGLDRVVELVRVGLVAGAEAFETILRVTGAAADGFARAVGDAEDLEEAIRRLGESTGGLEALAREGGAFGGDLLETLLLLSDAPLTQFARGLAVVRGDAEAAESTLADLAFALERTFDTADERIEKLAALDFASLAFRIQPTRDGLGREEEFADVREQVRALAEEYRRAEEAADALTDAQARTAASMVLGSRPTGDALTDSFVGGLNPEEARRQLDEFFEAQRLEIEQFQRDLYATGQAIGLVPQFNSRIFEGDPFVAAPEFRRYLEDIRIAAESASTSVEEAGETFDELLARGAGFSELFEAPAPDLAQPFEETAAFLKEQDDLLRRVTQSVDEQREAVRRWAESERERLEALQQDGALSSEQVDILGSLIERIVQETDERIRNREETRQQAEANRALNEALAEARESHAGLFGAIEAEASALRSLQTEVELAGGVTAEMAQGLNDAQRELREAEGALADFARGRIGIDEVRQAIAELRAEVTGLQGRLRQQAEPTGLERFFSGFVGSARTAGDAIEEFGGDARSILDGFNAALASGEQNFERFERAIIAAVARILLQLATLKTLQFFGVTIPGTGGGGGAAGGGVTASGGSTTTAGIPSTFTAPPASSPSADPFQVGPSAGFDTFAIGASSPSSGTGGSVGSGVPIAFQAGLPGGGGGGDTTVVVNMNVQALDSQSLLDTLAQREVRDLFQGVVSDAIASKTRFRDQIRAVARGGA